MHQLSKILLLLRTKSINAYLKNHGINSIQKVSSITITKH